MSATQIDSFDNAIFWEERYRRNIALGSGGGSRGRHLRFKRQLLAELIDHYAPRSVLDVGCGDIEVTRDLSFASSCSYTGIDLSPFVVERNREIKPEWQFLQGDFLELRRRRELQADFVLCLDVLIHQHDRGTYRQFVQELLRTCRMALVVNAFESLPQGRRRNPNTAFHEPLTTTLREGGAETIAVLGSFRKTSLILVERSGTALS